MKVLCILMFEQIRNCIEILKKSLSNLLLIKYLTENSSYKILILVISAKGFEICSTFQARFSSYGGSCYRGFCNKDPYEFLSGRETFIPFIGVLELHGFDLSVFYCIYFMGVLYEAYISNKKK